MDRGQEHLDSEIAQVGKGLLSLLQGSLCPDFVRDKESITLAAPWDEEDYRVGIYLYDIQDFSVCRPAGKIINEEEQRFPPKAVELSYMVFCNEKHRFGGSRREQLHATLNEIVRTVYDNPVLLQEGGEEVELSFLRESADFKIRLWGSFHQALQPAVYVRAVPVLLSSRRRRTVHAVRKRDYRTERKP
ncbi:MAG: DUF4255 domain-containing protein [Lachnospiraceae bacterium]|nr:DUF4255 domain-containing protein [Lachnospiraceae bacterium]